MLAEPVQFTLSREGTTPVQVDTAQKIVNQADNLGNRLPLTGGNGIGMLTLLGVGLVGGGSGYYVVSSRRRRQAER